MRINNNNSFSQTLNGVRYQSNPSIVPKKKRTVGFACSFLGLADKLTLAVANLLRFVMGLGAKLISVRVVQQLPHPEGIWVKG